MILSIFQEINVFAKLRGLFAKQPHLFAKPGSLFAKLLNNTIGLLPFFSKNISNNMR